MAKQNVKISGQLLNKNNLLLAGLHIEAWDKYSLTKGPIGKAITGKDGRFKITFTQKQSNELFLDKSPALYFKIYENDKLIHNTEKSVLWNSESNQKDLQIIIDTSTKKDNAPPTDKEFTFTVFGKVTNAQNEPLSKQKITVVDIDLRLAAIYKTVTSLNDLVKMNVEVLGTTDTAHDGSYSISFSTPAYSKQERALPDAVTYVTEGDVITGRSRLSVKKDWGSSFNLLNHDVMLLKSEQRGIPEYAKLLNAITPLLNEAQLKLYEIAASKDQVIFLAEETNQELNHVYICAQAALRAFEFKDQLSPELLYAMGRQQLSLQVGKWALIGKAAIIAAIQKSIAENNIGTYDVKIIHAFADQLLQLSKTYLLESKDEVSKQIQQVLSFSTADKKIQSAFITAQQGYVGTEENFWNTYLPGLPEFKGNEQVIKNLQLTHELAAITQLHIPLIEELQVNRKITDAKQLMRLDKSEWAAMITKKGVPENSKSSQEEYIHQVQCSLDVAYPTHRIHLMIETNAFKLHTNVQSQLQSFLRSAADFEIGKSNVDEFEMHFSNLPDKEIVKKELKTIQRLYQISPNADTLEKLKNLGFTSAAQVSGIPEDTFISSYSDALGAQNALAVMQMANAVHIRTQQIGTMIHQEIFALKPGILRTVDSGSTTENRPAGLSATIKNGMASFEELFGTMSYCECDHCRSMYSPAAYLVDVLRFLEKSKANDVHRNPYQLLTNRRLDLAHLNLTCENTNTLIPYIDLINEVLEYYVANNKILDEKAAYDTGNSTAEELRSSPQNTQVNAYRTISDAVYPFTLPYHQPLDVIHTYLAQLKIDRFELMNLFRLDASQVFDKAYFNFSDKEYEIITSGSAAQLHQQYGYNDSEIATFHSRLHRVPEFLKRTGITYVELIELLKTQFLNPGIAAFNTLETIFKASGITSENLYRLLTNVENGNYVPVAGSDFSNALERNGWKDYAHFKSWLKENFSTIRSLVTLYQNNSACDISTTELRSISSLYAEGANDLTVFYDRFHRFVRLWRKLGWNIREVDQFVTLRATAEIDPAMIKNLAFISQIQKASGIPLSRLSVLWGLMDASDHKSTYHRLFLNKSIRSLDDSFAVQANGSVPQAGLLIEAHTPAILAAIGISENDLRVIKSDLNWRDDQTMDLQSLGDLYKYALLSKTLNLSIIDFVSIKKWVPNPFDPAHIDSTLAFIHTARQVKSSGFTIDALNYLFGSELYTAQFGITPAEATDLVKNILKKLPKIDAASPERKAETQKKAIEELWAQLAASLKITTEIVQLLGSDLPAPLENESRLANKLMSLQKAALLVNTFKLEADEVSHMKTQASSFGNVNFELPAFESWSRIAAYVSFRNLKEVGKKAIMQVLEAALKTETDFDVLTGLIAELFNWNRSEVVSLQLHFGHTTKNSYFNELALHKYYLIFQQSTASSMTVKKLKEVSSPLLDFKGLNKLANDLKLITKSTYDEAAWLTVSTKLSDVIREHQKQALIGYVMTLFPKFTTADELYEHFLIDVQMETSMDTSRIKQAISSVQLFIQRCLLGLESTFDTTGQTGVSPEQIDTKRWEWMKNYRIWEANRKIFLYPENWLEPEWRDDKTPFFKELESELLQSDITDDNVEKAFRNYLGKLDAVSNLDVVGLHQENKDSNYRLHVVGRTRAIPYHYYYRTYTNENDKWEAWAKIPVDIKGVEDGENSGVHLVPIIWKGRLFLFWPEFFQKVEQMPSSEISIRQDEKGTTTIPANEPKKYWEIKLAWTELKDEKWTPKTMSKEFLIINTVSYGQYIEKLWRYQFNAIVSEHTQVLTIIISRDLDPELEGDINIDNHFKGKFILNDINEPIKVEPLDTRTSKNSFSVNYFSKEIIRESILKKNNETGEKILNSSANYKLLYDYIDDNYVFTSYQIPFCCTANSKNYFVKPININQINLILPNLTSNRYTDLMIENADLYDHYQLPPVYTNATSKSLLSSDEKSVVRQKSVSNQAVNARTNKTTTTPKKKADNAAYATIRQVDYVALKGNNWEVTVADPPKNGLQFRTFFHPHVSKFIDLLNRGGVQAVLGADTAYDTSGFSIYDDKGETFKHLFDPNYKLVDSQYAVENIDFSGNGTYSMYNWELFFQIPLFIATRLSKNGKYAEAMQWFHSIFDPTTNEKPVVHKESIRYWKFLPFRKPITEQVADILEAINVSYNKEQENDTVKDWREYPFQPHKVAAKRPSAYMVKVVLQYVENLTAWGDDLFRKDTMESINEATQLYVIANHILGKKPEFVPKRGEIKAETYASLSSKLDDFGNAFVDLENIFPSSSISTSGETRTSALLGLGKSFYFCIPANDKMLKYWDTVADRLFKIRHCQNIEGIFRKLALFEPPIDPGLLVQATAAGLSISEILSTASLQRSNYRFHYLLQKANEFCNEVKALGASLLNAIEKKESELIARIRAGHEGNMLTLISEIKERQVLEARINKDGLMKNRETLDKRRIHYLQLLGVEKPPTLDPVNFLEDTANSGTAITETIIAETLMDADVNVVDGGERGVKLISKEKEDLDKMEVAYITQNVSSSLEALAGILHLIPEFAIMGSPFGVGTKVNWGGQHIGAGTSAAAKVVGIASSQYTYEANRASKMASYIRREQDWVLQANMAGREIIQLDKQILGAQIRIQIAQKELKNHQTQIENTIETELFLHSKFTNEELYQWQQEQLLVLHRQSYQLAYDLALKAEAAYRYERGIDNNASRVIQFNYWDNSTNGLLSGEKLQFALRQLDKAYMDDNNTREYELTKHISLSQINAVALLELKRNGACILDIPEALFDMDYPGHYFRRIKSVSISIPCIAGPYTTIAATLTLNKNSLRKDSTLREGNKYEQDFPTDERFSKDVSGIQSIATSGAQNDSGLFELNFRDERYLPFEGAGAISSWEIKLNTHFPQFDLTTITDVIIHLKYTAREGGKALKDAAVAELKTAMNNIALTENKKGLFRVYDIKREFSTEWHKFLHPGSSGAEQQLVLENLQDRLPYFTRNFSLKKVAQIDVVAVSKDPYQIYNVKVSPLGDTDENMLTLGPGTIYQGFHSVSRSLTSEVNLTTWTIKIKEDDAADFKSLSSDALEELFLIVRYTLA